MKHLTVLLLALAAVVADRAAAQEKENPIATQVRAGLKDLNRPFTMLVIVQVKEGTAEKFETAFAKAIIGTRKEKGNIEYDLNRDLEKADHYLVYERWRNFPALEAHLKTPHITTLLSDIGDLLAMPPTVRVLTPAGE